MEEAPHEDMEPSSPIVDDLLGPTRSAFPRSLRRGRGLLAVGVLIALGGVIAGVPRDGAESDRDDALTIVDDRDLRSRVNPDAIDGPPTSALGTPEAPSGGGQSGSDPGPPSSEAPSGPEQAAGPGSVDPPATPATEPTVPVKGPDPSAKVLCAEETPASSAFSLDWRPPALPAEGTVMYLEWRTADGIQSRTFTHENSEITRMGGAQNHFMLGSWDGEEQWFAEFAPEAGEDIECGRWAVDRPEEPPILRVFSASSGCTPDGAGGVVVDSYGPSRSWDFEIELRFSREGCGTELFGYVRYDV